MSLVLGAAAKQGNLTLGSSFCLQRHEIQQSFRNNVSQVIRLYPGATDVELEWLIGPISIL